MTSGRLSDVKFRFSCCIIIPLLFLFVITVRDAVAAIYYHEFCTKKGGGGECERESISLVNSAGRVGAILPKFSRAPGENIYQTLRRVFRTIAPAEFRAALLLFTSRGGRYNGATAPLILLVPSLSLLRFRRRKLQFPEAGRNAIKR